MTERLAAEGPNAEQIEYWNDATGPKWVELEALLEAQIGDLGRAAMDRAQVAPGERVIDVGCGCGATTLELAGRVGASGSVLGVDVSAVMLARARERLREAGAANAELRNADAQIHRFAAGERDLVFSRFGVMFFADPVAAFANLRSALRPGGRLAFVCWRPLAENPWMRVPVEAVAEVVELPPPPPPGAPGPFAFGDAERVRGIFEAAGFRDAALEPHDRPLALGGGAPLEAAVDFALRIGPAGRALAEAAPAQRERVRARLREALAGYATPRGVVLDSAAWLVTARRPA